MLHVTDDMDDLFRKAADSYPLNTANPEWDKLEKKMAAGNNPTEKPKKYSNRKYLLLLLLLIIPFVLFINNTKNNKDRPSGTNKTFSSAKPVAVPLNKADKAYATFADPEIYTGQVQKEVITKPAMPSFIKLPEQKKGMALFTTNSLQNENISGNKDQKTDSKLKAVITIPETSETAIADIAGETITVKVNDELKSVPGEELKKTLNKKEEEEKKMGAVKNNNKPKKSNLKFYAGIIGGPDVSSVKLQTVKKTGFGFGLVTGYHINKKWSVETGLLFDKKYYSTDGKYFNMKNMPMSGYYEIDYADGACNMLEIPLNIRYQFKQKKRSALFVSAGISSYLMKKEFYNYTITHYGVSYTKEATYHESRNSFASVANISGGYIRKLGSIELRIEPYLKLPLRKVGIGSLPLQSAGLHVGITKNIF